jgi:S1-C subfamily serine protease
VVIGVGDKQYTIYGDDGSFSIPSSLLKQLAESSGQVGINIKLGESGKVLPIGPNTVEALKKLYAFASVKEEIPPFALQPALIAPFGNFQKLVAISLDKVVGIKAGSSVGTGFVADSTGQVFTNRHVVQSKKSVEISYTDGTAVTADVVYRDREKDFAILRPATARVKTPLPLCYATYPKPGEEVFALGNPLGLANTVTRGIVSSVRKSEGALNSVTTEGTTLIQTDAAVNPGNSGGPLLNGNGEVVGIVSFKRSGGEGLNFALSIVDVLESLKAKKPGLAVAQQRLTSCGNLSAEAKLK